MMTDDILWTTSMYIVQAEVLLTTSDHYVMLYNLRYLPKTLNSTTPLASTSTSASRSATSYCSTTSRCCRDSFFGRFSDVTICLFLLGNMVVFRLIFNRQLTTTVFVAYNVIFFAIEILASELRKQ